MEFKDYYATLGIERSATAEEVKRAYRRLARKYHPDVSKEPNAETRFKEVAEAHEALIDPERRAAYDDLAERQARGQPFEPPPGWDSGYEFSGRGADSARQGDTRHFSDFFETLFGQQAGRGGPGFGQRRDPGPQQGGDHHAKVAIDLMDVFRGAHRTITLKVPVTDAQGHTTLHDRKLAVTIPKGVREGQHLRLAGQGSAGAGGGPPGDLFLEIRYRPHPRFRVEERDIYVDLPVTPTEAALGATVAAATPDGEVQLSIPARSNQGRKLRLKGRGLPGDPPGDLYVVLAIALPPPLTTEDQDAYRSFARAFPDFSPRKANEETPHG